MNLLRNPPLQFLLLGAAVFAVAAALGRPDALEPAPSHITISRVQVDQLRGDFSRLHRRPPTVEEEQGLLRELLRDEVAYREALALGLDRDDAVIRHRLREKMEFLFQDVAALPEPNDAQLSAYLREHADRFQEAPRVSFEHIFLDPAGPGTLGRDNLVDLLAQLDAGTVSVNSVGDPFALPTTFTTVSPAEVEALFGPSFASALANLPQGHWRGPIESGYGTHLVRVEQRNAARAPALEEVRDDVRREWSYAQRERLREQLYDGLLSRYAVTIEPADSAGAAAAAR